MRRCDTLSASKSGSFKGRGQVFGYSELAGANRFQIRVLFRPISNNRTPDPLSFHPPSYCLVPMLCMGMHVLKLRFTMRKINWCRQEAELQAGPIPCGAWDRVENRSHDRKSTGTAVFPVSTRSDRISPSTLANLKPWPDSPAANATL
jgi:hypothetical protein